MIIEKIKKFIISIQEISKLVAIDYVTLLLVYICLYVVNFLCLYKISFINGVAVIFVNIFMITAFFIYNEKNSFCYQMLSYKNKIKLEKIKLTIKIIGIIFYISEILYIIILMKGM
jgi:hypothetical protein